MDDRISEQHLSRRSRRMPPEQKALEPVAPRSEQEVSLTLRFNPLGDHAQTQWNAADFGGLNEGAKLVSRTF